MGEPSLRPADEAGIEDDFLYHLYRGGELLAAGKNQEARDELERAFHLKPRNQKAQNLLGLVYFKLGLLQRSAEVYEMLVQDNPTDPTLRVNLGLVHLKSGDHARAIHELETAVDLSPEQQKPLNYLGLAYTQARQHDKALETFRRAGNQAMVDKMERALAAAAQRAPPPPAAPAEPAPASKAAAPASVEEPVPLPADASSAGLHRRVVPATPPPQPVQEDVGIEVEIDEGFGANGDAAETTQAAAPAPAPPPAARAARASPTPTPTPSWTPSPPPAASPPPTSIPTPAAPPPLPAGAIGDLLRKSVPALGPEQTTFHVGADGAFIRIRSDLHSRLSGLCWLRGEMQRTPEQKRFRGRATDKPFGEGADRLYALGGRGEIFVSTRGLFAIELGEEALFLLEDALFAFEDTLSYENGRVSSPVPPDLFLVHLRGQGSALLRLAGELRSLPVQNGEPLVLPMDRLVGWTGGLTPSVLAELGAPAPGQPAPAGETPGRWLRLEGEGWALWTLPPK
ncbi:MAG: tetratricopeptide repeat protein [Myxococcales bacterium]